MAQQQVTKDSTPEEVLEIAEKYFEVLQQTKLAFSKDKVILDMKRRAAEAQTPPMTVEEWEQMWAAKNAGSSPPPEPKKARVRAEKPETAEDVQKRVRGAVVPLDRDYFWVSQENQAKGRTWLALRKQAGVVQHMLVTGPSGCGKTEGMKHLAAENGLPFYKVDCASVTTSDKWVGHKEVNEKGTFYVLSEHLRWLSGDGFEPGILLYDEINRLHPTLLNLLIPILDGSQSIWVPDLGIYVKVHPDTIIAATANIGVGFSGTYGLDVALHDRFGAMMESTFPPQAEEEIVLQKKAGIDATTAKTLVNIATQARLKADNGELSKPISTRALIDSAYWAATGMSITEACEATFVKKYSPEGKGSSERTVIRLIIQGMAGGK